MFGVASRMHHANSMPAQLDVKRIASRAMSKPLSSLDDNINVKLGPVMPGSFRVTIALDNLQFEDYDLIMPRCHLCGLKLSKSNVSLENYLANQNLSVGQIKEYRKLLSSTKDHLIPKSLGGSDAKWNLKAAHAHCNHKRQNIPILFFRMLFLFSGGSVLNREFHSDQILNSKGKFSPFPKKILNSLKC